MEEEPVEKAVEVRPVYRGVVNGRIEHDERVYLHGETFTTHDPRVFEALRAAHALKLEGEDPTRALNVIEEREAEIAALKAEVERLQAAAMANKNAAAAAKASSK